MEINKVYQTIKNDSDDRNVAFHRLSLYGAIIEELTSTHGLHVIDIKELSEHNDEGKFTIIRIKVRFELIEELPKTERVDA